MGCVLKRFDKHYAFYILCIADAVYSMSYQIHLGIIQPSHISLPGPTVDYYVGKVFKTEYMYLLKIRTEWSSFTGISDEDNPVIHYNISHVNVIDVCLGVIYHQLLNVYQAAI